MSSRVKDYPRLVKLLPYLAGNHFVATVQLTLEVTDTEGLNPSLNLFNKHSTFTGIIGGSLNGTQDRSVTVNYAVDLKTLQGMTGTYCPARITPKPTASSSSFVEATGLGGGIGGDLGLADIVGDGLTSLDESRAANIYSTSGPVLPAVVRPFSYTGTIALQQVTASGTGPTAVAGQQPVQVSIQSLVGTILFAPQAAGVQTQGTVTLNGVATLTWPGMPDGGAKFIVNWTGNMVPPNSTDPNSPVYFSLTGNLTPVPGDANASVLVSDWGFNPTVTLTGSVPRNLSVQSGHTGTLALGGILTPATGSLYATAKPAPVTINELYSAHGGPGGGSPGPTAKGGSAAGASSAGGTSFGSVTDFSITYSANGGPNWTITQLKGPANGSGSFASLQRMNTDTLSITFVAACQDAAQIPASPTSYWDSLPACDDLGIAQAQSQSVGYQNNSLMLLRNFLPR
jgi:hypothetical protein